MPAPMSGFQPTRILFICHDAKIYGSQKSLRLLIDNLPQDRYRLVVSFAKDGPLADYCRTLPHVQVQFHNRLQGAKHTRRTLLQKIGDAMAIFLGMGRVLPLVRLIQQEQIDIVHTNSLVSLEGAFAAKLAGVPHVWHIREMFMEDTPRFHLVLGRALTKTMVHHLASRVITISNYVARQFEPLAGQFPNKYRVVYNAIDCAGPLPQAVLERPVPDTLNLCYLGRISDGKRFQDIVEAFCLLQQHYPQGMPMRLKVLGEFISPTFQADVTQRLAEAGLTGHVDFLGYHTELDPYLDDVDVVLMPSSAEAFGRTMLDAMVRGIAVVAPASGAPPEVLEEGVTGFFYAPNNPQSLADCLANIYDNRGQLKAMRKPCWETVLERFSAPYHIQQLDAVYQEIRRRKPHAEVPSRPCWHGS